MAPRTPSLVLFALLAAAGARGLDPADLARPLSGTGGHANVFPGPVAPFGMIQWSPDTEQGLHKGGYWDAEHRISGFGLDHLSGAGCSYGENFQFMPLTAAPTASPAGNRTAFATGYSHAVESAQPGFYGVRLDNGIGVELTATTRAGFGRFRYPATGSGVLAINAGSAINGARISEVWIDPVRREITGRAVTGHFCRGPDETELFFCARFDRPFAATAAWSDQALQAGAQHGAGRSSGAVVTFALGSDRTVLARVALSYVSVAGARANLAAECPAEHFTGAGFAAARAAARTRWNRLLSRVEIAGGTEAERATFYSMLYHALIMPSVCSDSDGRYRGYDGAVHAGTAGHVQYANFSGWDIYRSECQLLALLAPAEASDMAQSLVEDYRQGGSFPRWGVPNQDSGEMIGDPSAPMIADFYAFGARGFDTQAALRGLMRAATDPGVKALRTGVWERTGLANYLKLGYVPEQQRGGSVSMTLEYGAADFALGEFARALGDDADARICFQHAANWRHLFNPATGYLAMRRADGTWAPGFVNNRPAYDGMRAYVEGTAGQYLWMVPYDLKTLARLLGGPETAAQRLNHYFEHLRTGWGAENSDEANLGNEDCLNAPWIYCFLGRPWQTQAIVRRAMMELYSDRNDAYPGNDDLGEMSSWYVFAALGLYPELPGSDVLVLGSPLFPRAVVHLAAGDLTIVGRGADRQSPYVQSLRVDGREWSRPWVRFGALARGATLEFALGREPRPAWGSRPEDAPPSLDDLP